MENFFILQNGGFGFYGAKFPDLLKEIAKSCQAVIPAYGNTAWVSTVHPTKTFKSAGGVPLEPVQYTFRTR